MRHNEKSSLEVISQAVADDKYPAQAETTYYVHCHVNETDSERPGKGTPDNIFASSALKAKPIIGLLDEQPDLSTQQPVLERDARHKAKSHCLQL